MRLAPIRGGGRGESGAASAELVLATPVLLVCILVIVQFALWSHASHVATAAAQEGARAARLEAGTAEAGEQRAQRFLEALGREVVERPEITASRDAEVAAVEVRGSAASVLPGYRLPVRGRSRGPVERFRADTEP